MSMCSPEDAQTQANRPCCAHIAAGIEHVGAPELVARACFIVPAQKWRGRDAGRNNRARLSRDNAPTWACVMLQSTAAALSSSLSLLRSRVQKPSFRAPCVSAPKRCMPAIVEPASVLRPRGKKQRPSRNRRARLQQDGPCSLTERFLALSALAMSSHRVGCRDAETLPAVSRRAMDRQ